MSSTKNTSKPPSKKPTKSAPKSRPAAASAPSLQRAVSIGVRMSAPEMWRFEWERRSPFTDCEDDDSLPLSLGLGLSRPSHDHLIVELSVEVDTQQARFVVAYRSEWEIEDYITFSDTEGTMRSIAGQLGPSALYPFIREAVTSASIKSGLPPITLPVINFREFFNLEDIQIPSWQEE